MVAGDRLAWYAEQFNLVEVNSSFYSVPDAMMAKRWCDATPPDFIFDLKLHQLLSRHAATAKLLPPKMRARLPVEKNKRVSLTPELESEMVAAFFPALEIFRRQKKLGLLLLQLSPAFSPARHSLNELKHLFELLRDFPLAVELRNRNWTADTQLAATLDFFRSHNLVFVNVDAPDENHFTVMPSDLNAVTNAGAAYLRLHGRNAKGYLTGKTVAARFNYDYSDDEIGEIAERTRELASEAKEVHVIFNNNARDYAPHAALRLRKALGQIVAAPAKTPELF